MDISLQDWERRVSEEVDQSRYFLGVPRATSRLSDIAIILTCAILLAFLAVVQSTLFADLWKYLLALAWLRLTWIFISPRAPRTRTENVLLGLIVTLPLVMFVALFIR